VCEDARRYKRPPAALAGNRHAQGDRRKYERRESGRARRCQCRCCQRRVAAGIGVDGTLFYRQQKQDKQNKQNKQDEQENLATPAL
jgi:hypothetical protein